MVVVWDIAAASYRRQQGCIAIDMATCTDLNAGNKNDLDVMEIRVTTAE